MIPGHFLGPVIETAELDVKVPHLAEQRGQPAELSAQTPGPHGKHRGEHVHSRAHPPRRHPHLMERFDVLSEARPRHACEHRRGFLAKHPVGELAERRVRGHPDGPEVRGTRDTDSGGHETSFELGQGRRLKAALTPQPLHEWLHCVHPGRLHLDLDASQAEPSSFVPDRDDRVVQRELSHPLAVDSEIERTSPCPHLQNLVESPRSRERLHPPSDLTGAIQT